MDFAINNNEIRRALVEAGANVDGYEVSSARTCALFERQMISLQEVAV